MQKNVCLTMHGILGLKLENMKTTMDDAYYTLYLTYIVKHEIIIILRETDAVLISCMNTCTHMRRRDLDFTGFKMDLKC